MHGRGADLEMACNDLSARPGPSTHSAEHPAVDRGSGLHERGSLYEAFPGHPRPSHPGARTTLPRTPAGLVESRSVLGQCVDRRIDDREKLEREIAAWERQRNRAGAHLKWMFTTEKARTKMGRAYPRPAATLDQPAKES